MWRETGPLCPRTMEGMDFQGPGVETRDLPRLSTGVGMAGGLGGALRGPATCSVALPPVAA